MNGVLAMEKNEKPLKKRKKRHMGFIAFLLIAFVLSVAINFFRSADSRLETMIVRKGLEEEIIETKGFVFRDQTVIYSSDNGYIYCLADEDSRVKNGETVAYIYKNEVSVQINEELEFITKEIERFSDSSANGEYRSSDAAKIEQDIARTLRNVPSMGYNCDFESITEVRQNVNVMIENKRVAQGKIAPEDSSGSLENLLKRKAEIESQYNVERSVVYAPTPGAFTSRIDGMESYLHSDNLENVSVSYLEELDGVEIRNVNEGYVEKGAPMGKIVGNFKWSVAAVVPSVQVEDVRPGDYIGIRFTDITVNTIDGTVANIINEENGKSVIVVNSEAYVETIYSTSKANVQFVKHKYEGFRVPSESIRMVDGKTGVYIVKNNKSRFVPIDILYNNKEWAIVSERVSSETTNLKLYDELIISGKNLYDNKVVR